DLLAIQLDDRAVFLQRWWTLLQDTAKHTDSPALQALAKAASTRPERASVDSASYRLVRGWRINVISRIEDGLTAPAKAALGKDVTVPKINQIEGVAWPLLTQRPPHLLPRRHASCASPTQAHANFCQELSGWDALLEDAAHETSAYFSATGPLQQRTWGERNTARICHPLAASIPLVGKRWLCMPPDQLRGDSDMPLVAGPDFGASERMVVSPGREAGGIIHMPGGQSGNPLSPFWGAGHADWVHGRATPFLPGKAEYSLKLSPQ
ncbi:MAG: penicillin acylase family protein, partial [Thermomonas sp.]